MTHQGVRAVLASAASAVVAVLLVGCGTGTGRALRTGAAGTTTTTTATASTSPSTSSPIVPPVASSPTTTTIRNGGSVTSPTPPPAATTKPPTPITRPPLHGVIELTSADANGTFAVGRGQSVQLTLSDQAVQWGPVTVDPTGLLRGDPAPPPAAHGQLVLWTAMGAGTVKLSAVATAYCAAGTACPMFARLFHVTLIIS